MDQRWQKREQQQLKIDNWSLSHPKMKHNFFEYRYSLQFISLLERNYWLLLLLQSILTSFNFSDNSPRIWSSLKNLPWYLCSKYSVILARISRGSFRYTMYSSTCFTYFDKKKSICSRKCSIVFVTSCPNRNKSYQQRTLTFSRYCLLEESRLWMRFVAWPRNIA